METYNIWFESSSLWWRKKQGRHLMVSIKTTLKLLKFGKYHLHCRIIISHDGKYFWQTVWTYECRRLLSNTDSKVKYNVLDNPASKNGVKSFLHSKEEINYTHQQFLTYVIKCAMLVNAIKQYWQTL